MFKFSLIISFFLSVSNDKGRQKNLTEVSHSERTTEQYHRSAFVNCFTLRFLFIEGWESIFWRQSRFNLNPFGRNNYKCFKQKECTWWNVVENDCLESWWEFNVATFLQPAWAVKFYTTFPGLFLPICKVKVIISCIRKITVTTPSLKTDKSDKPNCLYFVLITYHFPLTLPHLNFIKA